MSLRYLSNFSFDVHSLFKADVMPEVFDMSKKTFDDLREKLLEPVFKGFATLMIGKLDDLHQFAKEEFQSLEPV